MKILYLSPTYFSEASVIGGGERYALELAKAMAKREDVRLLSFSKENSQEVKGGLQLVYLKSFAPFAFLKQILWADVIHCHQFFFLAIDFAIIFGKLFGKKVFVSDLGGATSRSLAYHLPLQKWANSFLLLSEYSKSLWLKRPKAKQPKQIEIIYGGIDIERFSPRGESSTKSLLFVGRQAPHKGIEHLIDALEDDWSLHIVGRPYDKAYSNFLKQRACGKKVAFHESMSDEDLIEKYRTSLITAQVSVYETYEGHKTEVPELLGLAALESMACATPVVVSDVASLPELVMDGENGFVVKANSAEAIREKIKKVMTHPELAQRMGLNAREHVKKHFTWDRVVERCLEQYRK